MNIEEVLTNLGYNLIPDSKGFRSNALYRDGDNKTAILIYKNGNWIDFVNGKHGNLEELIQLTLQLKDINGVKQWLKDKKVVINTEKPEPTLNEPNIFPIEWIESLKSDHSYWINRGISEKVLKELKGGVATEKIPRMKGRYCLGIWNSEKKLIGLQGRSLNGKMPKYKILGEKSKFCYPLHLNIKDIKKRSEIILVEGVGCMMSCFDAGIRNIMVLFGITLSNHQLSTILAINPKNILISTNNDNAGGENARKIQSRLLKFFDKKQVKIKPPILKDLNEMLMVGLK